MPSIKIKQVDALSSSLNSKVFKSGDTMNGTLTFSSSTTNVTGLLLKATGNTYGVTFKAPDTLTGNTAFRLPNTNPSAADQVVMSTDTNGATRWGSVEAAYGNLGTVQLSKGSGVFTGSSSLYYDIVNNKLGIGTSSPSHTLSVSGSISANTNIVAGGAIFSGNTDLKYLIGSAYTFNNYINFALIEGDSPHNKSAKISGASNHASGNFNYAIAHSSSAYTGNYNGIMGGREHLVTGSYSGIIGGYANTISNGKSAIIGGDSNTASGLYTSIIGGENNQAIGNYTSVMGGQYNSTSGASSVIIGGVSGFTYSDNTSIIGGYHSSVTGKYSTIVGGYKNTVDAEKASVVGGEDNVANATYSSIVGGSRNTTNAAYSSIVGGYLNTASGDYSSIVGGNYNVASGTSVVIIGGNSITGTVSNTVYVPKLNINTAPANDDALTQLLARGTDGTIKYRNASSFSSAWLAGSGNDIYYTLGEVGIGTASPTKRLHVSGDTEITGGLVVSANTTTGTLITTGNTTIGGALNVTGATTTGTLITTGNTTIGGALNVTGNTIIGGQAYTPIHATSSAHTSSTITLDFNNSNVQTITLSANTAMTLANPTNINNGSTYMVVVKQGISGGTLSFGNKYLWEGGTAPTITSGTTAIDVLSFVCFEYTGGTSTLLGMYSQNFS